ncbi:nuclear transport factor 2 family protein [Flavihumibacter stibioxidans]|uniref:DUF4440 domain-containing protein n=1 Tax=Flavihumibacter stibioxidans TaxID=1834163 RepID=A0ABR7M6T3_9BACT|nr:nuclear transport factor 2 family protein [Flavihumibacter stibioxidans]MBC6490450.1 hypothetical protein [Flavihumibacter stibioxidans]
MRTALLIIALFWAGSLFAQDTVTLKKAMLDLNEALLKQDSATVRKLLHGKCSYGHSNAWIESKKEVIADMFNGVLRYNSIKQGVMDIKMEDKTGIVRTDWEVNVTRNGQVYDFKLHVLLVWIWKKKKGWQLIARQSTRI